MKQNLFLILMCLACLSLVVACGGNDSEKITLDFQTIEKGSDSGYSNSGISLDEPILLKMETQDEFEDFWSEHTSDIIPVPKVPSIDFEEEIVIALIDVVEPTGGYSIEIESLEVSDEKVIVRSTKVSPSQNCLVSLSLTQPYHIIKTSRSNKSFLLSLTNITDECENS